METKKEIKKLTDCDLKQVAGGAGEEPEEFEWQPKGYQTPVKEIPEDCWIFEPIGEHHDSE